jgi:site-specific DNA-methyltransferase (adenine-specific)/modification methylase
MSNPWKRRVEIGDCVLYEGDALEIMPTLSRVDAVVTDPPFGVGNFVQTSGNVRGDKVKWNDAPPPLEAFQQIRNMSRHRIIWGANFFNCFEPEGGAIFWDKCQPMPNFSKGDIASCTHYKKTEIVRIPWTNFIVTHKGETDHPCERPTELYRWCIEYLPQPIETILDPYLGSGSCGVAAVQMGRRFIGIELDPGYFDIACKRIEEAYKQPRLFDEPPPKPVQERML